MLIKVSDRLSDQGASGVVVFRAAGDALVVDSMALSCAVLGKQVEYAAVSALAQLAAERHFSRLVFEYNPSGRNQLTLAFLQSIADRESDTRYVLPLGLAEARLSAGAVSAGAWTVKIGSFSDSLAVH
jgi:predicted enzyme involved in methoxymalonyl-ACP biosynthesis